MGSEERVPMDVGDGHGDGERGAWGCPYIFGLHLLAPSVDPLSASMTTRLELLVIVLLVAWGIGSKQNPKGTFGLTAQL